MPPVLIVSGPSILQELVYDNTLLGRTLDDVTPLAALTTLLAGTAWATGTVDGGLSNISARFDGAPIFNAVAKLADILGVHVREIPTRKVDFGAFGVDSGIVLMAPPAASPAIDNNPLVGIIQNIKVTEEGTGIINRVIPCGAGEGNTLFQLGPAKGAAAGTPWSTRSIAGGFPYDIEHDTGPNAEEYYYLEDAASVAAYGTRKKVLADKDIAPIANSPTAFENAANALYDLAAAYLGKFKDPLKVYDIGVSKLADTFRVGDTVRVVYRGIAETDVATRTTWLNVDANLVVLEKTRSFDASGADKWDLKVATVARYLQDDQEILIGALETLRAFRTSIKYYTFEANHGTERDSVATGHNFDYTVEYDANVSYLHKVKLYVQLKKLKSSVTGGAGGGHTHELAHHHHVDAQTSQASGDWVNAAGSAHKHVMFSISAGYDPFNDPHLAEDAGDAGNFNVLSATHGDHYTGAPTSGTSAVSLSTHTHTISAKATNQNEDTTTSSQTHTHTLVYGIYEAGAIVTPNVQVLILGVDRTAALGGGAGFAVDFDVDISGYLVDVEGHPLRQKNVISLRSTNAIANAFDLIVQIRSLLSASAIEASGLAGAPGIAGVPTNPAANTVFAGRPDAGVPIAPTFRPLVTLDLGTGAPSGAKFLRDDLTWVVPAGGGGGAADETFLF